jgi:predicted Zn-dependent protease
LIWPGANQRLSKMTGDVTGTKLREAQLALAAEKFQEAEKLLEQFINAEKVEPDAARLYVYLLEMTERRKDAQKFVDELVKKSPDEVTFLELNDAQPDRQRASV